MSVKSDILLKQLAWATEAGLTPDKRGYLSSYEQNLFQPLNEESRNAFDRGSGSELRDRPTGPAKMRALHSSSALAVNFFHAWIGEDTRPLLNILGLDPEPAVIHFERQYPTGLPGNPPNIDVALEFQSGFVIGIESKFTEWLSPKSKSKSPFKEKYFPKGEGVWQQVGLPESQRLAEDMQSRAITFRYLDAPQLLKHALGLATHLGSSFRLFYVYYGAEGRASAAHDHEIGLFSERLKSELGFQAFSYQDLFLRLQSDGSAPPLYLKYLNERYF